MTSNKQCGFLHTPRKCGYSQPARFTHPAQDSNTHANDPELPLQQSAFHDWKIKARHQNTNLHNEQYYKRKNKSDNYKQCHQLALYQHCGNSEPSMGSRSTRQNMAWKRKKSSSLNKLHGSSKAEKRIITMILFWNFLIIFSICVVVVTSWPAENGGSVIFRQLKLHCLTHFRS